MEEAISQIQKRFDEAELKGDKEELRKLISDDFLSIGPKGFVLDKSQWIDRHDQFKYHQLKTEEIDIRMHGPTAIVRNIQRNKAEYKGHPVEVATRVMQVWVKEGEEWRLAGIQFSPLAEERMVVPSANS
jgi:ketosteroid isomerase-like protein